MLSAVDASLDHAVAKKRLHADGDFFSVHGQVIPIRSRELVVSATLRRPEMLPPAEISEALTRIVGAHVGITTDEAIIATCRLFGFRSSGPQLKKVIGRQLDRLVAEGGLRAQDGKLFDGQKSGLGS